HADDRPMTEAGGELGEGFSVDVAKAWERAFFEPELPGVRRIALRTAIVLGRGSVMIPLTRLTRLGLGGPQLDGRWPGTPAAPRAGVPGQRPSSCGPGTPARVAAGVHHRYRPTSAGGRQRFSWVHLDDVVEVHP